MRGNPIESEIFPDVIHKKNVLLDKNFFEKLITTANIHSIIEYRSRNRNNPRVFNITLLDNTELQLTLLFTISKETEDSYIFRINYENYSVRLYKGNDNYEFFIKKEIITSPVRRIKISIIVLPKVIVFQNDLNTSNPTEVKNCVVDGIREMKIKVFSINTSILEANFSSAVNALNRSSSYLKNINDKNIKFKLIIDKPKKNTFFIVRMNLNTVYSSISDKDKHNLYIETDTGFHIIKKPKTSSGCHNFIFNKAKNQLYSGLLPVRTNVVSGDLLIIIDRNLSTQNLFYDYNQNFLMLYSTSPFLDCSLAHNNRYVNKSDEINPTPTLDHKINSITERSSTDRRSNIPLSIRNNMNNFGNKIASMFLEPRIYHTPDNHTTIPNHQSHVYNRPMNSVITPTFTYNSQIHVSNIDFFNKIINVFIPFDFFNTISNINNELQFVYTINNEIGNLDYYSNFII